MKIFHIFLFCFLPIFSFAKVDFDGLNYHFRVNYPGAKEVVLIFSFDNYTTRYHMSSDDMNPGHFFLTLDIPKFRGSIKPGKYYYRAIVDGIMTYDADNPNQEVIPLVGTVSYFEIKDIYLDNLNGPVQVGVRTYRFFYHQTQDTPPSQVFLTSDYDSWNLYKHILKPSKEDPKVWYTDVHFDYPGKVQYSFVVDGKWVPDWNNENSVRNNIGQDISVLNVQ